MSWIHDDPVPILSDAIITWLAASFETYYNLADQRQHMRDFVRWLQDEHDTVFTALVEAVPPSFIAQAEEAYLAKKEETAYINAHFDQEAARE